MKHEDAEAAAHVGRTIARQAGEDLVAQVEIEEMDEYQKLVAVAAAAQEIYRVVSLVGAECGHRSEALRLADMYRELGAAEGLAEWGER